LAYLTFVPATVFCSIEAVEARPLEVTLKFGVIGGVVFGVAPEFGLLASQREVMETNVSIIEVSLPFIVFCNGVSKAFARTLLYERGSMIKVSNEPEAVLAKLRASPELIAEWTRIMCIMRAVGCHGLALHLTSLGR
jgi:hypothetical protein